MNDPLIQLKNLSFAYDAERPVLDGLSLDLQRGQRLGLIGGNGSGKTTLLHLIVGLIKPRSGRVVVFGQTRSGERDFKEVRRRVGLVFQDADDQLFCPTVLEDVAFGPRNLGCSIEEARESAVTTLRNLGLEGFENRVTYRLSGGEKRLVALATVLAMKPDVLLLDEPGGNLDETSRARLTEILASLPQTILLVTHEPELLNRVATDVVRLENGAVKGTTSRP